MILPIYVYGSDVLRAKAEPMDIATVNKEELQKLVADMFETMYETNGVGLAAPQVGILKRIVVIDTTGEDPILLINPVIVETSGEQTGQEGCLSVPGKCGIVTRPNYAKVKALNEEMEEIIVEGEELLMSEDYACPYCDYSLEELEPRIFSIHFCGIQL